MTPNPQETALQLGHSRLQVLVELSYDARGELIGAVVLDAQTHDGYPLMGGVSADWMDFADRVILEKLRRA